MPIHDYFIDNGTGANVRADINAALSAIVSLNSNPTEPGTMYAYQLWADTTSNLLKIRNSGNSAWITLRQLDGDFSIVAVEDGAQATPSLTFTNDLNTGIFRPGNDSLAIVTGATRAITITSTQAVGIRTPNPSTALHVAGNARVGADDVTDAVLEIGVGASGNRTSYIDIVADTTYTDYGLRIIRNNTGANATSELKHRGTGALNITTQEAAPIEFYTTNSPRVAIDSSGRLLVGTSSTFTNVYHATTAGIQAPLQVRTANNGYNTGTTYLNYSASGFAPVITLGLSKDNTAGSNTVVANNDELGYLQFVGNDGTNFRTAAWIAAQVDGTPGSADMPGRLVFSTTPDGGSSPTSSPPAMTIKSSQEVLIGTSTITANGGILQLKSGITFPATAVAATDVNTLDDYEEGTWTPTQGAGLTVVGTFTSAGHYTKVGRQVTVQGFVRGSTSVASAGGSVFCSGLPFAVQNVNDTNFIGSGSDGNLTGLINIWIDRNQAGVYSVTSSAVTASIYFTGSYFTP